MGLAVVAAGTWEKWRGWPPAIWSARRAWPLRWAVWFLGLCLAMMLVYPALAVGFAFWIWVAGFGQESYVEIYKRVIEALAN